MHLDLQGMMYLEPPEHKAPRSRAASFRRWRLSNQRSGADLSGQCLRPTDSPRVQVPKHDVSAPNHNYGFLKYKPHTLHVWVLWTVRESDKVQRVWRVSRACGSWQYKPASWTISFAQPQKQERPNLERYCSDGVLGLIRRTVLAHVFARTAREFSELPSCLVARERSTGDLHQWAEGHGTGLKHREGIAQRYTSDAITEVIQNDFQARKRYQDDTQAVVLPYTGTCTKGIACGPDMPRPSKLRPAH